MRWVQATGRDFKGDPPSLRSGHTAIKVGKSLLAVFGGLVDKKFLNDLVVLDTDTLQWFKPECTGNGESGHIGPSPRAFHVCVAIDCHLFIFGGRCGRKRLGDFWMLDTDTWQWAELSGYGELPPPREFAAGASVGNGKIVIYGGWDGTKWLSDVYVLDTISLQWRELVFQGPVPPPRCGHTATMVEKRMLIFGGRGAGGPIMGDLWALKGLFDEEREIPAWTQLKIPGSSPAARCGHSTTAGGPQLLIFGGHGTGGWLTRYDVYHNDCVILDRATAHWKKPPVSNEPPARAYHSMSRIGYRFLLLGGYDGKNTFGDIWWLVSEDDPIANRASLSPRSSLPANTSVPSKQRESSQGATVKELSPSPLSTLRQRLGLPTVAVAPLVIDSITSDEELLALGQNLLSAEGLSPTKDKAAIVKAARDHWRLCEVQLIRLQELGILLRDYQRLVAGLQSSGLLEDSALHGEASLSKMHVYRFNHFKDASQVRMDDIPSLVNEYRQLLHMQSKAQSVQRSDEADSMER
ncbi:hypothetical protein MPTK1_6g01150 [Marchantia polymorpha subsp. ruderalis]|uniref:Uncharacterized protein n=2 Tax=Marchantia polymorpha TaxID=3197 RepID=A0AAF6BMA8_MARPO|nr:hypothetical protein MARPO_0052s0089 [Marchantia polymorpha]PTQ38307.1 hypothetical protein MARPO_0052s0089 [Marchantia polymorpha]BBN13141.1 hypothetical protein Mp_6g01150 [Marchantia polymorpha subsp. ruderalis]BBN13142.1 hypothetical protein Mp_6g01150 [Marchantia polymorpha subsp. ruderalis]|eukprot:PTQ38306.1 hypothetical protein MARPO_0052s0089 [Marchantia polymorpha]